MQVIDNRSETLVEVLDVERGSSEDLPALTVRILEVRPVSGYANLLATRVGEVVRVVLPSWSPEVALPAVGSRISLRIRAASASRLFGTVRERGLRGAGQVR